VSLFFSLLIMPYFATAAIQVGDSATFLLKGDVIAGGKSSHTEASVERKIEAINPDGTLLISETTDDHGAIKIQEQTYTLNELTRVNRNPEGILSDCKKLGYNELTFTYKNREILGCEIKTPVVGGYMRVVIAPVPLYRVLYEVVSSNGSSVFNTSDTNVDVSF
jgi:hypothetical protein